MDKTEPSSTVGGNINWCSNFGEQYRGSSKKKNKKLKIELLHDPGIPLLGIYLEKTRTGKDTCTLMFIAALFTIARTWKQPKCPSTKEWIKMWYIYTMEYCSAIKRNEIVSFVETLMDLETVTQSESEKEKQIFYNIACM